MKCLQIAPLYQWSAQRAAQINQRVRPETYESPIIEDSAKYVVTVV
jgi:hypothetical protein